MVSITLCHLSHMFCLGFAHNFKATVLMFWLILRIVFQKKKLLKRNVL